MSPLGTTHKVFLGMLSSILTAVMVACVPAKGPQHLVTKPDFGSAIATQTLDCEGKIRQQMDEKKILIQNNVPEFSADVENGNKLVLEANDKKYSVVQVQKDFTDLRLAHEKVTHENLMRIEYSISRPDKESKDLLKLQIEIATVDQQKSLQLKQEIRFDSSCTSRASETSRELILRMSAENYKYSMVRVTSGGAREAQSGEFNVPAGQVLFNFVTDVKSVDQMPDAGFVYMGIVGLFEFHFTKAATKAISEFGLDLTLQSRTFQLARAGKHFEDFYFGRDEKAGVILSESFEQKTWEIPRSVWLGLALAGTPRTSTFFRSDLPKDYLLSHDVIQLSVRGDSDYDHFSAYWLAPARSTDSQMAVSVQTLVENSSAEVIGGSTPEDLESNETIQTQLPEIQAIAKDIRSKAGDSRMKQIELILKYLSENFKYDYEMFNNNLVHTMTTSQALAAKKGVCQHFAVLFAAISRAMQIPSRIVVGYLLYGETPGFHAWNEIEISPGTWQVVEPQAADSLSKIHTRFYFPIARGYFLEDNKRSSQEMVMELVKAKVIKPLLQ